MPNFPRVSRDSRWIALYVLCIGMLMIVLDNTVVNVALPSIQKDLGFSEAGLAWVVNAYLIAFAGILLLSGRLGDLIGKKRVFLAGITAFTLSSVLCGLAWNATVLVMARFLQGLGGAMASAVILAMIFSSFRDPKELARAMGVFSFTAAAGGSIGLLIGGGITQALSWHWIFFVNVPVGIATILIARRVIEADRGIGLREGADVLGAFLITAGTMLGVYTVVEMPARAPQPAHTILLGAVALGLFCAFLIRQAKTSKPLMPLRLFSSRNLSGANAVEALTVMGMFGFFFLGALYFREVLHYDAIETGFAFLPVTIAIGALSLGLAERLATRFGSRNTLIGGIAVSAAGMALLTVVPIDGNYAKTMLVPMLLLGVGLGAAFPPVMTFAMSDVEPEFSGAASGVLNTVCQVGGALGLAILASVASSVTHNAIGSGTALVEALARGYRVAFAISTGCLLLSMAIAIWVLQSKRLEPSTATRDAWTPALGTEPD